MKTRLILLIIAKVVLTIVLGLIAVYSYNNDLVEFFALALFGTITAGVNVFINPIL